MNEKDIEKGLLEGWLIKDEDDWYKFIYDFIYDNTNNKYIKIPTSSIKRIRLIR